MISCMHGYVLRIEENPNATWKKRVKTLIKEIGLKKMFLVGENGG